MTSPSKLAAGHRDGELENTALRPGYERTRSAAHSEQPACVDHGGPHHLVVVKTPLVRIRVGYAGRRIGGLEKGPGAFPVTFDSTVTRPAFHRAVAAGSVVRSEPLPAAVIAGRSSALGAPFRLFQFLGRVYRAARTRFPVLVHSAPTVCQDTSRRTIEQSFHFNLSAGSTGLVACFERHEASERKFPNGGKHRARPGNLTARDGNA